MILDKCNKLSPWARYKTRVYENMKSECKEAFVDAIRILKAAFVVSRETRSNKLLRPMSISEQAETVHREASNYE